MSETPPSAAPQDAEAGEALRRSLEWSISRLEQARPFAKVTAQGPVLDQAARLLIQPDGIAQLYALAPRLDAAGVFAGSDWDQPQNLLARLVGSTLDLGKSRVVVIECLSLLRMLAIARGLARRPGFPPDQARHFLTQAVAHNLKRVFGNTDEAVRMQGRDLDEAVTHLFRFLVEQIGYQDILGSLCAEIWRILGQRPIEVGPVKAMITQIAVTTSQGHDAPAEARLGTDRLVSALFGPTVQCQDDPGLEVYAQRLGGLDDKALRQESRGFARAMHDVGLVSDYHAVFLRWLLEHEQSDLIGDALGLSSTGLDGLRCYTQLVDALIREAVTPETAQAVLGLALLLERGGLHVPAVPEGLWRQLDLQLSARCQADLERVFGRAVPARVRLLAAVICMLGQPLGVGQGNNPSCQSARALSMWALNDPDYLLYLIAQAARFDQIHMEFEGQSIDSATLPTGLLQDIPLDNDAVSTLLVPHLDRIYAEMCRRCADRAEDPHHWVNPEFHGWWVGRQFSIAVDVASGQLKDFDNFVRHFYASYHPLYNGNQPVVHPQPAGLAVTDNSGRFVGWHAITLLRVALDRADDMRVYFFNPNNDSGQDWGQDIVVSTAGHGERYGESSLRFHELLSRLYIFHDEPYAQPDLQAIPTAEVERVTALALDSWASGRSSAESQQ